MEIIYDLCSLSTPIDVVTLGFFDGCHLGHQSLFSTLASFSGTRGILTFDQHPQQILNPTQTQPLISSSHERLSLLSQNAIEYLCVLPFTRRLANQTALEFLSFLQETIRPQTLLLGYDSQIGSDRQTPLQMAQLAEPLGIYVMHIPPLHVNGEIVSSKRIRSLLAKGNLDHANTLLGYPYYFKGSVHKGAGIGGHLGIRTINIFQEQTLLPLGVYACEIHISGSEYQGVMNLGFAPTMNRNLLCLEAHIFSFHEDVYDQNVRVIPRKFLRKEKKFPSKESLREAILKDIEETKLLFSNEHLVM